MSQLRAPIFRRWIPLALLALVALGPALVRAQSDRLREQPTDSQRPTTSDAVVEVQGYVSTRPVPAGESARAAVLLTVREGWHVNAHEPPLDYLIGTTLTLTAPEGLALNAPTYPTPKRLALDFAQDSLDVYAGRTPIFLSLQAHADSTPGPQTLRGEVRVQACNDRTCLRPATVPVGIPVEVGAADADARPVNEDLFESHPSGHR